MRSGLIASVGFVEGADFDFDLLAQHAALSAIERQAVQHGQRIGRNGGAEPLDDVAVIVVMRRLDQHQRESFGTRTHVRLFV